MLGVVVKAFYGMVKCLAGLAGSRTREVQAICKCHAFS